MLTSSNAKEIEAIRNMKKIGRFDPYIEEVSFPHFKNLERGLSIRFDFPVTALVGQNGANKSSILRALQSCPDQNSISDYWFDTDLDHIESEPNDRQRYIHRYKVPSGNMAEVIKIRIQKESRGEDYFETAKPRIRDGMHRMPDMVDEDEPYRAGTRWRPIKKEVIYIDFRAQLPAFDILMSYQNRKSRRDAVHRKSLVRLRSRRLEEAIRGSAKTSTVCGTERLLSEVVSLDAEELKDVGEILGRSYESIKLVKHDLYDYEGWTAKLVTTGLDYSEAFAGSGEFAAISIVRALHEAEKGSLILLDEPETSLHPGAQAALCTFFLKMCKRKLLQVVMATHSREMVQGLPAEGRKLLGVLPGGSQVSLISSNASLEEASLRLGADFVQDAVFVEDGLAAEFLKHAFRKKGEDAVGSVRIEPIPGGAQTISTRIIPVLSELNADVMVVLDGDQDPELSFQTALPTIDECSEALKEFGIEPKHILMNGGDGDNEEHRLKQLNKVLLWIERHVRYLPGKDPEGLLLSMVDGTPIAGEQSGSSAAENKKAWCKRAAQEYSKCECESITSEEIFCYQKMELSRAFANKSNDAAQEVMRSLLVIVDELLGGNLSCKSGAPLKVPNSIPGVFPQKRSSSARTIESYTRSPIMASARSLSDLRRPVVRGKLRA